MSRVFVSCAHRDRAMGERLAHVLRILGHEPVDDRDDRLGTAWWNEVAGRIESSDVFVAVVSPAYVEAQACRLAVKHAAESGVRVVRVDLGTEEVEGGHPVVARAPRVLFDPDADIWAAVRLAHALDEPPSPPTTSPTTGSLPRVAWLDRLAGRRSGRWAVRWAGRWTVRWTVAVLGAIVLVAVVLAASRLRDGAAPGASTDRPAETTPATPPPDETETDAAAAVQRMLGRIAAAGSVRLPVSSCQAGGGEVTCHQAGRPHLDRRPDVLPDHARALRGICGHRRGAHGRAGAGERRRLQQEAVGGELAWNLNREQRLDITVEQQEHPGLDPNLQAAGRVFCTASENVMTLAWTQDPGLLVSVAGQPASQVVAWWQDVHLELACTARGSAAAEEGCRTLAS